MATKRAKTKAPKAKPFAADVERKREVQILTRSRNLQRRAVKLSRDVTRAVRQADAARLTAARELCADTGYAVFGVAEWDAMTKTIESLRAENERLIRGADLELQTLEAARAETERIASESRAARKAQPAGAAQ